MNAENVSFREEDYSLGEQTIPAGISGVSIECKRGPINRPDILITSSDEYYRWYGGLSTITDDALLAIRALNAGTQLRVNNIGHYTDITNKTTLDADFATMNATDGSRKVTITGSILTGSSYNLVSTGFVTAVVPFNTTALQTVKDLLAAFKALNPTKVLAYSVIDATHFTITPAFGYALTGSIVINNTTTPAVIASTNAVFATLSNSGGEPLFVGAPKAPGAEYNKLVMLISAPSNGIANNFNLSMWLQGEEQYREDYINLKINGPFEEADQNWLDDVNASSYIAELDYLDLSSLTNLMPDIGARVFSGGDNGSTRTASDYNGDSASKLGWYAFDPVDDISQIAAPVKSDASIHIAGTAYAQRRQDIVYFAHLSNGLTNEQALVTARDSTLIDSSFMAFFAGGLKVKHPISNATVSISEMGDILGIASTAEIINGADRAFAGPKRGLIYNALGIVNNFGIQGNQAGMNLLANHQINLVIVKNKKMRVSGNFTGQITESLLSFLNVRRLIIHIKKSVGPILEQYIEDPCIIQTWKYMYLEVKPFFEALKKSQALYDYRWEGDQFAKNMNSLVVNKRTDTDKGKYKVRLFIQPVPGMREIEVIVTVLGSSISFEEILGQTA